MIKYFTNVDFRNNTVRNFVIEQLSEHPLNITQEHTGKIYFNTTQNILYVFDGINWLPLNNEKLLDNTFTILNSIDESKKLKFNLNNLNPNETLIVYVDKNTFIKNNFDAITNPTNTDDTSKGYSVGSRWINKNQKREFVAINVETGNAIWIETTNYISKFIDLQDTPNNYENQKYLYVENNNIVYKNITNDVKNIISNLYGYDIYNFNITDNIEIINRYNTYNILYKIYEKNNIDFEEFLPNKLLINENNIRFEFFPACEGKLIIFYIL